jgi:acetyl esterase/lipase
MIFGDRHGGPSAFTDLVLEHDAVVVSLEYRLAPENQDPVPVEDCYAGLVWTSEHLEELGVEPGNLMIAGHSGGGGLAAGAALLARDRRGPHLRAQLLMSPMLDDRATSASSRQFQSSGTLSRDSIDVAWQCVLGDRHGGDEVSPYAAPARAADLSGLPTTYIDCGSAEVFRDEATAYATDIWAAGGQAELHVWAGGFHGFDTMAPDAAVSRAAVAARQDWMERVLGL